MGIQMREKIWDSFRGGRYTRNNLVKISDDHVLLAKNLIFPGDGIAHKRPGYTLVQGSPFAGVKTIFDYHRQSDAQQFVFLAGNGNLGTMPVEGGLFTSLSIAEEKSRSFDFATSTFACYGSNGVNAYRFVDQGGTMRKWKWGISAPATAPTIAASNGTLTLKYGREYAYSYVSKWIDGTGQQRVHVGAPSPLSAHTGAQTAQIITLGALVRSDDPQVSHIWVWATNDTPFNTTSVLFLAGEVLNGTAAYGDAAADLALDSSRQAPFSNQPAPAASILLEYQQRIIAMGIEGKPDLVQASGLEEIDIGIPQECFPPSVFFNVPGGIKAISGGCVFNQSLMIGTPEFWFQVRGFSADTFVEHDKIFSPGPAGKKAICVTPTWMVWLGVDRKIWAWNGFGEPTEVSWKIARGDGSGALSMESLDGKQIANAELRWYSFGRYSVVAALVSTTGDDTFDWVQLWDVSALAAPSGYFGPQTKDGLMMGAAESDAFFSDRMVASGNVVAGNGPYLFLADEAGNIYRWPDGWTDNGANYTPALGTEFSDLDIPDAVKRMRWTDIKTSRIDAVSAFNVSAVVTDGVNAELRPSRLKLQAIPAQYGPDPTVVRAMMNAKGVATGRLLRLFVEFPRDEMDAEVYELLAKFSIVGKDAK